MQRSIDEKSDMLEDIWTQMDVVAKSLEEGDPSATQRTRSIQQANALTQRQDQLRAEIDELEADVAARKADLAQHVQAMAIND